MGQPALTLDQARALAVDFGLDFLELRVLEGNLDLPAYFEAIETGRNRYPIRVLGSPLRLTEASSDDTEDFLRYADLAERLQAPYVRVFGGGSTDSCLSPGEFAKVADLINSLRKEIRRHHWHCEMLLETHSAFALPWQCQTLNKLLDEPVNVLWDSHHTWKYSGEAPEATWNKLGPWVRHVHYKDSRAEGATFHYVLPGEGEFPGQALFNLLREKGYQGGVSLEWEKLWHQELPPLRTALEKFNHVRR